jgi:hypothetical protein
MKTRGNKQLLNEVLLLDAIQRPERRGFLLWKRFDEERQDGTLVETKPNGDRVYEFVLPAIVIGKLYVQGSGGGGGGGGGASGRGPQWLAGGGGAGGNGCVSSAVFPVIPVEAGDKLQIVLGHGGAFGAGAIGTDQFGSHGGRGGDSIVYKSGAVLFHFPGANPGLGGQFKRGDGSAWLGGEPSSSAPPSSPTGYAYTAGGRGWRGYAADGGQTAQTPPGGIGGKAGASGGGGGGSSLLGNGGDGGNFASSSAAGYGRGSNGAFGSGGGGGAGGGPGTSDNGGLGGTGGLGYVLLYTQ